VVSFSSVLPPSQSQLISVLLAVGERQQVLRFRRLGDQIEVRGSPAPRDANARVGAGTRRL